jgi:hypothetical protein
MEMIEALRRHKAAAAKARECNNRPIILRSLVRFAEAKLLSLRHEVRSKEIRARHE